MNNRIKVTAALKMSWALFLGETISVGRAAAADKRWKQWRRKRKTNKCNWNFNFTSPVSE